MSNDDENRIIEFIEQKVKSILAIDDKWLQEWAVIIEKYFKLETRSHIRLKTIAALSQIYSKYHVVCEDELMSKIILPNFNNADQEPDSVVRRPVMHLLFDLASACLSYKHCNAILAIIRRILNKPFKTKLEDSENAGPFHAIGNIDVIDSRLIISNLNKLFRAQLHHLPIDPAVNMLDISINYLNLTYKFPFAEPIPAEIPMIKKELFSLLLNLRCNKHGHLGIVSQNDQPLNQVNFSPFIIVVKRPTSSVSDQIPSPVPDSPSQTHFPLSSSNVAPHQSIFVSNSSHPNCPIMSRCVNLDLFIGSIVDCLNHETDLDVLKSVLDGLSSLLANKPLILSTTTERINQLCLALSDLTRLPKTTQPRQPNNGIDIVRCGLNCLTSMLVYRKYLEQRSVRSMLSAFEDSLRVSRNQIVPLLITCLIELRDSPEMTKFLPVVLNRLSKFTPTLSLAISMLEFLSYLILFPKLYENFSDDEYKFIFAIALPYTNPFRFTDYVTCLAFRIIAIWYLTCRPPLRSTFVDFVRKSLQSNVIQPFKENYTNPIYSLTSSPTIQTPPITYSCPPLMSQIDQRKRSSSFNTENNLKQHHQQHNQQPGSGLPSPQLSLQINEELIETFADLLSRYKHGQCLSIAPKNIYLDPVFDRSTSQTWLLGNSLVTITSSQSRDGWAEILIRRPTGNTCFVGRLQNTQSTLPVSDRQVYLDSLSFGNDVISLFKIMSLCELDRNGGDSLSDALNIGSPPSLAHGVGSSLATSVSGSSNQSNNFSNQSIINSSVGAGPNNQQSSLLSSSSTMAAWLSDPIPLPKDKKFDIALSNFDHITPYETHKVGIVYVGKNQINDKAKILSNKCGSIKYYEFLRHIGTCIVLKDIDPELYFIGGLDVSGEDGQYAYFWKDNVTQVIFHVATFMPHRETDPHCNNKNRHIGNDHVCIIYNDSLELFQMSTIKGTGQFITACIIITPGDDHTNTVDVEVLPGVKSILKDAQHIFEPKVLSNLSTPLYARQLAIHLNLASKIYERHHCEGFFSKEPYVSNWVERLRSIKRIRQRLDDSRRAASQSNTLSRGSTSMR